MNCGTGRKLTTNANVQILIDNSGTRVRVCQKRDTRVRTNIGGRNGSKTFRKFEKYTRRPRVTALTNSARICYADYSSWNVSFFIIVIYVHSVLVA
jgi:hypothetical protein